jgi:S1-C subfamily serine protease
VKRPLTDRNFGSTTTGYNERDVGIDRATAVRAAALLAAGLVGGAVALGAAAVLGELRGPTTTVRELVGGEAGSPAAFRESAEGLSVNEIYRRWASGVVQIEAVGDTEPDPFDPFAQPTRSLGSGFVIDKAGHVVTNFHVVRGADSVKVSFSNAESVRARIVGVDPSTDLAVLKVDSPSRALTPLQLGRSSEVQVGDAVVAIGNPFGYERSVTAGIVSAVGRTLQAPNSLAIDNAIQTDAQINQGNSGGPLLNARGEVIGVNTQIATGGNLEQGNGGIGFAVPVDTVKNVASQLIKEGKVEHAFIGLTTTSITPDIQRLFRLPAARGLLVDSVVPGSGAAEAGIRPGTRGVVVEGESWRLGGDIVVKVDGIPVASAERLRSIIARKRPGEEVAVELWRGDRKLTVDVELGKAPAAPTG